MGLLRFLLALAVILTHTAPIFGTNFVGGELAVETFFIISGFYMALILNEKYIKSNDSYWLFISNRFLRLYPVYWVVLILTALCSLTFPAFNSISESGTLKSFELHAAELMPPNLLFLITTNIFIFFQDAVMFMGVNLKTGTFYFTRNFHATSPFLYGFLLIPQAWSIGLELTFYLIAPFIARKKYLILFLLLMSIVLKRAGWHMGLDNDPWTYRFLPFEMKYFLLGMVSYFLYKRIKGKHINKYINVGIHIGLCVFTILYCFINWRFSSHVYISSVVLSIPFLFNYTKSLKFDRILGELSYPMYIVHIFVFNILKTFAIAENVQVYTIVGSAIISFILIKCVGDPIERFRQSRVKNQRGVNKAADALSVTL